MLTPIIICITVIICVKIMPTTITVNFNKTLTVPTPPQPDIKSQSIPIIPEENEHMKLAAAINDILTDFNGGDHAKE